MCAKMREESLHLKTLFIVNTLTLKPSKNPKPFGGKRSFHYQKSLPNIFLLVSPCTYLREIKEMNAQK
jgi:hypothetical protein